MNVKHFLEAEIKNKAESHAYLLIGNRLEANIIVDFFVKTRNILPIDITSIDQNPEESTSKEIKVEETRRLLREISFSPQGKQRLAVIYNCEKLNASSGNVLLKSLEEPTGPVIFILVASTSSILPTIKSRCRILNLDTIDLDENIKVEEFISLLKKGFPEASALIEKTVKEDNASILLAELTNNQRKKLLDQKKVIYAKNLEEIEMAKKELIKTVINA